MHRYFIRFKASHSDGRTSEHTRYLDLKYPIEYDSDVAVVQAWAQSEVGAVTAILMDWKPMKGRERLDLYDGPAVVIGK